MFTRSGHSAYEMVDRKDEKTDDEAERANHFRRQAASCFAWAERMSLEADRSRLLDMASGWLDRAAEIEGPRDRIRRSD